MIRLALSPFQLKTMRMQLKQRKMNPEIKSLRKKYKKDPEKLSGELIKVYQKYQFKPFTMISTMIVQVPILAGVYTLFLTKGSLMMSFILPWIVTFAEADPWHVLPILSGVLTFITMSLPILPEMNEAMTLAKRILPALVLTPVLIAIMWNLPVAISLYWTTGNLYALAERLFFRTRIGKYIIQKG